MPSTDYWTGLDQLRDLVVFGASYCQTVGSYETQLEPSEAFPLGVPWPGDTYAESGQPNWVGHLVKNKPGDNLHVWNYSSGGQTVEGVVLQVKGFAHDLKCSHRPRALFNSWHQSQEASATSHRGVSKALFGIFVGINDVCGYIVPEEKVSKLFEHAVDTLYGLGSRNFLIFNVPPRLGYGQLPSAAAHHAKIQQWNAAIEKEINDRKQRWPDCNLWLMDSWKCFLNVFEDPEKFGFTSEDVHRVESAMWVDGLHPTSAFHRVICDAAIDCLQREP